MTPEQRRIGSLERKVHRMQGHLVLLVVGIVCVPTLLESLGLIDSAVLRVQVGAIVAIAYISIVEWFCAGRDVRRDAAQRKQDLLDSIPQLNKNP